MPIFGVAFGFSGNIEFAGVPTARRRRDALHRRQRTLSVGNTRFVGGKRSPGRLRLLAPLTSMRESVCTESEENSEAADAAPRIAEHNKSSILRMTPAAAARQRRSRRLRRRSRAMGLGSWTGNENRDSERHDAHACRRRDRAGIHRRRRQRCRERQAAGAAIVDTGLVCCRVGRRVGCRPPAKSVWQMVPPGCAAAAAAICAPLKLAISPASAIA